MQQPISQPGAAFLQVLGYVALSDRNGNAIATSTRKTLWVLACIATRQDRWRRDQLASLFWDDRQEEQARGSLRKSLSELRKMLGSDVIVTTNREVWLCDGALETDLGRLRKLASLGATLDAGPLGSFFAGEFMPEFDPTEPSVWLNEMRSEARDIASDILTNSIEHLSKEKSFRKACARARDLVSLDAFSEANHRRLMRLYVLDNETSKAAAQYRECQRLLRAELGVEPSIATRELAARILSDPGEEVTEFKPSKVPSDDAGPERQFGLERAQDVPEIPSIAVLPFDNMSGDPEQEYFSDGITEDIITKLAQLRWLFVIARNSTFVYKNKPADIKQVGQELGVQYVVEGSARRVGKRVRVTAQLIETLSGNHVWSQKFDRDVGDLFEVQDEVTDTICACVGVELSESERRRSRRKPADNLDAWDLYQIGMWHANKYGRENLNRAQEYLQQAIERSPSFARAYAGIAHVISAGVIMGTTLNPAQQLAVSLDYAQKAVDLDNREDRGFSSLGQIQILLGDGDAAITALERAVDINPCSARAYGALGWALLWFGRAQDAVAPLDRALRLSPYDPLRWLILHYRSCAYFYLGRYEEALQDAKRAAQSKGDEFWPYLVQAVSYAAQGSKKQAKAACQQALDCDPELTIAKVEMLLKTLDDAYCSISINTLRRAGLPEK
ncbi:BTAD domain-containing putative transcriptional regulator [Candidatus Rhodobacter oscarellae]|nr:BTAD domain-containing putative transcriptional regulator [Candidatus Rhodobacter lobularis]